MPGTKVPDFSIPATGEATFRLSDHLGHPVVLYFYPKDNTPGCTTEGADFRDLHKQFAKLGAVVAGVSRDSIKSHEGFKEKMAFPFPLLSDADEKLCTQFDVIKMKNMYGKKVRGIERSTFLVGAGRKARPGMAQGEGRRPRRGSPGGGEGTSSLMQNPSWPRSSLAGWAARSSE
jgi:peroxiredoxin Q/BCP